VNKIGNLSSERGVVKVRASMCIDCMKFETEHCMLKGKVQPRTWIMTLHHSKCDGDESLFHKVEGKYVCKKCGSEKRHNEHGCRCVLVGELKYLRHGG